MSTQLRTGIHVSAPWRDVPLRMENIDQLDQIELLDDLDHMLHPPRVIADKSNPFEVFDDLEFV